MNEPQTFRASVFVCWMDEKYARMLQLFLLGKFHGAYLNSTTGKGENAVTTYVVYNVPNFENLTPKKI